LDNTKMVTPIWKRNSSRNLPFSDCNSSKDSQFTVESEFLCTMLCPSRELNYSLTLWRTSDRTILLNLKLLTFDCLHI
jgi:hypothetical protein